MHYRYIREKNKTKKHKMLSLRIPKFYKEIMESQIFLLVISKKCSHDMSSFFTRAMVKWLVLNGRHRFYSVFEVNRDRITKSKYVWVSLLETSLKTSVENIRRQKSYFLSGFSNIMHKCVWKERGIVLLTVHYLYKSPSKWKYSLWTHMV